MIKTYYKFIINVFLKSFVNVFLVMFSLVLILNILSELEFFRNINVNFYLPIYLSFLNSPSLIFDMLPFIFLIGTQFFFINLFNDNQIQIFKYSGLKNSKILAVLSFCSFILGLFVIIIFYNFSSNLKNLYLELKNNYSSDDKYLAVITKNGLWIKDNVEESIYIINASKIDGKFLVNTFITKFDQNYEVISNIQSNKIDIKTNTWIAHNVKIYKNNVSEEFETLEINTNFNFKKIQSLFSNLSSLSIIELFDLRENYKSLNYSITEVDLQLHKIFSYPLNLTLMTLLSAIIMFNTKRHNSSTVKISIGLFLSVIIYYINNFFSVMGKTEKISLITSIWGPLIILLFINIIIMNRINEK